MRRKNFIFFILAMLTCFGIKAQDYIYFKSGDEIEVKVLEVGVDEIKYKKFTNQNGPIYTKLISDIFKVKYENGTEDVFGLDKVDKKVSRQINEELIVGSRLLLRYKNVENKRNVDGSDAVGMLKSYIVGKTKCIVVESEDEADFIVDLSVKKSMGRKAKIDIIHIESDKLVFESEWRKGSSAAWNGYSGTRQAIGEVIKVLLIDEYPIIRN